LQRREPIFNVPGVVLWVLGIFCAVHVGRWALPPQDSTWLTVALAFIPGRLGGLADELPGGQIAIATAFITHLFVHGDLTHLGVNSAWLLAFGSPVARRSGALRFLAFFAVTGIAGALLYLAFNGPTLTLVVGASGAISGLMGAAFRFLFAGTDTGGDRRGTLIDPRRSPLMPLLATLRDQRILMAVGGWTVLNIVLAWGAAGLTEAAGIAWEAHLGGFYAGLLLYGFFEPPSPPIIDEEPEDAAPAS
jgi:membrane associated rhomboid family serine protease